MCTAHYENLPIQNTEIFSGAKISLEEFDILLYICIHKTIDYGYTELSRRGGSNEYPQSMLWILRKIGIPLYIPVLLYKIGVYGVRHYT